MVCFKYLRYLSRRGILTYGAALQGICYLVQFL